MNAPAASPDTPDTRARIRAALKSLPADVRRVNHGRDPFFGFDCLGIVFWAYKQAGLSIDRIDRPYSARDVVRPDRTDRIAAQFRTLFDDVPVTCAHDWLDGDVLLVGCDHHLGIVAGGVVYQMLHAITRTAATHLLGCVQGTLRHRALW